MKPVIVQIAPMLASAPEHTVLLLLSDNPGRLLPTLRSRCQRIVFHRPDPGIAMAWLGTVFDDGDKLSTALTLAGGKPLLARDYLENGEMESRQALLAAFSQLLNREIEPVAFVAASKQLDSTEMTAYLLQISTIVIQYLLANHRPANISPVLSSIMDSLEAGGTTMLLKEKARESTNKEAMKETEKKAEKSVKAAIEESDEGAAGKKRGGSDSVTRLIQFNRMAEEAHRQLKSVSNPNPQLILESLLWRWSRITVPARGKYN